MFQIQEKQRSNELWNNSIVVVVQSVVEKTVGSEVVEIRLEVSISVNSEFDILDMNTLLSFGGFDMVVNLVLLFVLDLLIGEFTLHDAVRLLANGSSTGILTNSRGSGTLHLTVVTGWRIRREHSTAEVLSELGKTVRNVLQDRFHGNNQSKDKPWRKTVRQLWLLLGNIRSRPDHLPVGFEGQ